MTDELPRIPEEMRASSALQGGSRAARLSHNDLERHRIMTRSKRGRIADTFRILRTKLLQQLAMQDIKTIAVTSPNHGDGKSTVALNLAIAMALDVKHHVLLVDLDLRTPKIHEYLGVPPTPGLTDNLLDGRSLADCLIRPDLPRLLILPCGTPQQDSSELLGMPEMAALSRELKTRYPDRIVIYDMPPVLTQDDTIAFLPNVDGVLVVIRDGATSAEDVVACMHALEDANLLGTVLNRYSPVGRGGQTHAA